MKTSWVLPDGERNKRFNKLIKQRESNEGTTFNVTECN